MIKKSEINRISATLGMRTSTVDKDWVLGHFIDALFSIPICAHSLIFKGGTCLKKCRFPDYRFSEDLDFTSTNADFILNTELLNTVVDLVHERTGIPLYIDSLDELRFQNLLTGYAAHVKFWGADHKADQLPPDPSRWTSSVKLEIILYEKMIFEPELRAISHPYSDQLICKEIPCYSIAEVLSEKLRALIQRSYTAPRDYYDIWYLSKNVRGIDWDIVVKAFRQKMEFKNIAFEGVKQLLNPQNDKAVKAAWRNSLEHQIAPSQFEVYEIVRNDLEVLLNRIF